MRQEHGVLVNKPILSREDLTHPDEWLAFCHAIIDRGRVEQALGVDHRFGSVSFVSGTDVHHWPVDATHRLALAEDRVWETQRTLRIAQGVTP